MTTRHSKALRRNSKRSGTNTEQAYTRDADGVMELIGMCGHRAFCHSSHSVRIDAPAQGCAHSAAHRPHSNFKRQDTEGFYLDCPENQDHEYRLRAALAQIRTCKEKDLAKLAQFVRLRGGVFFEMVLILPLLLLPPVSAEHLLVFKGSTTQIRQFMAQRIM